MVNEPNGPGGKSGAGETPVHVTRRMAEWAASIRYEDLPDDVVVTAKRFLLDSVACALGGLDVLCVGDGCVRVRIGVVNDKTPGSLLSKGPGKRANSRRLLAMENK